MAVRALNAASGFFDPLRMLKVSAWSGEVIVPFTVGWTAKFHLKAYLPAGGVTQQVNHVCPSSMAMLPEANSLPALRRALATWAAVGMK